MARKVRTHKFNDNKYYLLVGDGFHGTCDSPRETSRKLYLCVNEKLNSKKGLQVLIGECLHAENWAQTEEVTHRAGDEIGDLLWRLLRSGQINIKGE